ncbi:hypothetical protein ACVLV4_000987 [Rathayibacter agropyri]
MGRDEEDVKTWFAEWRIWASTSVILALAWLAWGLFRGRFDTFWPLGVIVIWAAVLLSAPVWTSRRRADEAAVDRAPKRSEDFGDA